MPRLSPAPAVTTPTCEHADGWAVRRYHPWEHLMRSICLQPPVAHLASASEFLTWISSVLESSPWPLYNTQQLCIAKASTNASNRRVARLLQRRSCLPTAGRIRCARERSVQTLHVYKRRSSMSAVLRSLCSSTRSIAVHRLARRTPGRNAYQTRTNNCLATRPGL